MRIAVSATGVCNGECACSLTVAMCSSLLPLRRVVPKSRRNVNCRLCDSTNSLVIYSAKDTCQLECRVFQLETQIQMTMHRGRQRIGVQFVRSPLAMGAKYYTYAFFSDRSVSIRSRLRLDGVGDKLRMLNV